MDFRAKRPCTVLLLYLIAHAVAQNPAPFIPSAEYCCHKTRSELNEMKQMNSSCAYVKWWGTRGNKCDKCPVGTCRTAKSNNWHDFTCECPDRFLRSTNLRKLCKNEWGSPWPQSAGEEASFLKSCSKKEKNTTELPERPSSLQPSAEAEPINYNARYCCHMSKDQLKNITGVNPICTKFGFAASKGSKCGQCPVGMCRTKVPDEDRFFCECPQWFLDSDVHHERCDIEWNKTWPHSVGIQAAFLKSCPENESSKKPGASQTNPGKTVPPQTEPRGAKSNSTDNSDGKGEGLSPEIVTNSGGKGERLSPEIVTNSDGKGERLSPGIVANSDGKGGGLNPEIIASIVGGIFTLVGVLITVYCVKQRVKPSSEQEEVVWQYPD